MINLNNENVDCSNCNITNICSIRGMISNACSMLFKHGKLHWSCNLLVKLGKKDKKRCFVVASHDCNDCVYISICKVKSELETYQTEVTRNGILRLECKHKKVIEF